MTKPGRQSNATEWFLNSKKKHMVPKLWLAAIIYNSGQILRHPNLNKRGPCKKPHIKKKYHRLETPRADVASASLLGPQYRQTSALSSPRASQAFLFLPPPQQTARAKKPKSSSWTNIWGGGSAELHVSPKKNNTKVANAQNWGRWASPTFWLKISNK